MYLRKHDILNKTSRSVMNNARFGSVVIVKGDYKVVLPEKALRKVDGGIKSHVQKRLDRLTIQDMKHLSNIYGVEFTSYTEGEWL